MHIRILSRFQASIDKDGFKQPKYEWNKLQFHVDSCAFLCYVKRMQSADNIQQHRPERCKHPKPVLKCCIY